MQHIVPTDSENETTNNSTTTHTSSNSTMPPQVQTQGQSQMQLNLQQSYQPLSQLNQMHWQHQPQQQQQSQNELNNGIIQIPVNSAVFPSSPKLQAMEYLKPIKAPSPTNSDMSVIKSMSACPTKKSGSRSPKLVTHHQVKRGSGVDMKGPTPEVAQQLRFPWKLHLLLERCEYEHNQKLSAAANEGKNPGSVIDMPISWLPCGKAFKVHDKERFVKEIMPSFFGTQSFKTFQRNLNLWGFTRVSKGPQKDVCSHPLFLKGFPAVCQSMKRIVLKGTGRGNRAPLGGVDVSSVQAVVAAAAMQQAQQQAAQQMNQVPHHIQAQQVLQQQQIQAQHKKSIDIQAQQSPLNHIHHQNQQQQNRQQHQQAAQNQQQQQFLIENGSIQAAPMPSQQKLVVLPSAPAPSSQYSTTTVMWPNQQQQQQQVQQQQTLNPADATANLQKSLQQLSAIIQQLNGCNAMATAAVNPNAVNSNNNGGNSNNSVNTANFQQQQQQLQVGPTPIMQQQQQPAMMQQQQQAPNMPNSIVAPSPMSTQDLVALLLQRNLQQQVQTTTAQSQQPLAPQVQLQVPSSLFAPQSTPIMQQQQQPVNTTNFSQQSQMVQTPMQQGTMMGNFQPQQQQQAQQVSASPSPVSTGGQQQQQNQLLQLLLQQQGWATTAAPAI